MIFRKTGSTALQFLLLYATWFVLSGRLEIKYLTIGALAAGLVILLTADLLRFDEGQAKEAKPTVKFWLSSGLRFLSYVVWLIWSIVKANLQVAYLVLHPRMPIRPGLLRFRTRLRSNVGHIVLANSITLTPGTITVDLKDGIYLVHALVPEAAQSLLEAVMQNKLEAIFGETEESTPEILWVDDKDGGSS
jgi:multicomponent Na+:H+ antiporter subunit E